MGVASGKYCIFYSIVLSFQGISFLYVVFLLALYGQTCRRTCPLLTQDNNLDSTWAGGKQFGLGILNDSTLDAAYLREQGAGAAQINTRIGGVIGG